MFRWAITAVCFALPFAASAETPKELVGKYQMEATGGGDVLELRADGSAAMAGDETRWSAHAGQLTVGSDVMAYQLAGGKLLLSMGSVQIAWKRVGAAGKASAPQKASRAPQPAAPAAEPSEDEADREAMQQAQAWMQQQQQGQPQQGQPQQGQMPAEPATQPAPTGKHARGAAAPTSTAPAQTGGSAQDQQARQVLTSSAWCSFTYNKNTGTSTTQKVVYRPDGTLLINGGGETYNSGYAGTVSSQTNSSGVMHWKLENLRLYVDPGDGRGFQDIGLTAERNSNGYPILHALGREYSMCN